MNIILTREGYLINKLDINKKLIDKIKKELTVKPKVNKDYCDEIKPYSIFTETEKTICIPRYYGNNLFGLHKKTKKMKASKIKFDFLFKLRDYQIPITTICLEKIKTQGGGIIQLPCGRGKTITAIYLAAMLKVKTIVVVHKTFLQNQWYDRIKESSNASIGIIRQKKIDIENKDIVIAMLQSISMIDYDKNIFNNFGLVIFDEVHHTGSKVFCKALKKLGCKYTLGLSATPERSDGLTKVIKWYLGDFIYKEEPKNEIHVNVLKFKFNSDHKLFQEKKRWIKGSVKPDMVKMISNICDLEERNIFISTIIRILRNQKDRKILLLSDRIKHLEKLKKIVDNDILNDQNKGLLDIDEIKTAFYIGRMKSYELVDAEEADILFASYKMAEEGLDIPSLNTLIFATSKKSITQCVGRILRKKDSNKLIIDITDMLSRFKNHGSIRNKYYLKNNYDVSTFNYNNCKFISKKETIRTEMNLTQEEYDEIYSDESDDTPTDIDNIFEKYKCISE